ncbi:hypothetical protein EYF80_022439 [Liparis tanakae]|uniref:Uncharacterized protein n=1 Tax=Liparis tanakae TaxID=230148 RepID=A0A4Z2HRC1_9TELE|nr:hypothetical protein EYF80_022439 [Liparis tanakae]
MKNVSRVGCKSIAVSASAALRWCEEVGAEYFEGSARDGLDVERPFLGAARGGLRQVSRECFFTKK